MKQPDHLLHLCSYSYESGGPASVILNHSRFQVESGIDVSIASSMDALHHSYPTAPGVQLHVFKQSIFSRILSEFSWSLLFWFITNRKKYQYIHIHGLWYFGSILPFIVPNRAKKIITIHGFLDPYAFQRSGWKKRLLWNLLQKRFVRSADLIHVISREEEKIVRQLFPDLTSKIVFIPNGIEDPQKNINLSPHADFKTKFQTIQSKASFVFLFLSRINQKKGLDILMKAFEEITQVHGESIHLIIAGPHDDYSDTLSEQLTNYPYQNVNVFDVVTGGDKAYLLEQVSGFVLPSYSEGFSIAALEAMAYSKPCVFSTRIGFASELKEANAAEICEPQVDAVIQAMKRLLVDDAHRNEIGKRARALFLKEYQINKVASDFIIAMKQI
jgi:glycosyltransferase involved in cell wall biosynthesis